MKKIIVIILLIAIVFSSVALVLNYKGIDLFGKKDEITDDSSDESTDGSGDPVDTPTDEPSNTPEPHELFITKVGSVGHMDENNQIDYYTIGFSTTELNANTNYRIELKLKDGCLEQLIPYYRQTFDNTLPYKVYCWTNFLSGFASDATCESFLLLSAENLFNRSFEFCSGAMGDRFVFSPFVLESNDLEELDAALDIIANSISEVRIVEVIEQE